MGWTFAKDMDKAALIRERVQPWENTDPRKPDGSKSPYVTISARCLASAVRGNCLWSVWETTKTFADGHTESERWIRLDLLRKEKGYGWGYKGMCESSHPYYYSCPLKYLDMVPVANQAWRDQVLQRVDNDLAWKQLRAGQRIALEGTTLPCVVLKRKAAKSWIGEHGGKVYKVSRRFFKCVLGDEVAV